jgi:hypothetical protein
MVAAKPSAPSTSYRFDSAFKELMRRLGIQLGGVSDTDVIRIAVKRLATQERVE